MTNLGFCPTRMGSAVNASTHLSRYAQLDTRQGINVPNCAWLDMPSNRRLTCPQNSRPCRAAILCGSRGCRTASIPDGGEAISDTTNMVQIRTAAQKFIERYGADAPREAGIRATELHAVGELQGFARWQLIEQAANHLLMTRQH